MPTSERPLAICILCGALLDGMGHNPEPLADYDEGRCCTECNDTKVIPARLAHLMGKVPPPIPPRISEGRWVMVAAWRASDGDTSLEGQYLESYDPDAYDGLGYATWTDDPDKAMRFDDAMSVLMFWRQQSSARPLRDDGEPNRPLTAYTVEPRNLGG